MYRPAKPLEELALDLAFESFGEVMGEEKIRKGVGLLSAKLL